MGLKTKLAMAVATSAAGAAMVAGGSFALFTASTANTGNTFTAGTVKLDGSATPNGGVWAGAQNIGNLAPGDTEQGTLTIKNSGTLDEWVQVTNAGTGDLFSGATPVTIFSADAQTFKLTADTSITLHYTYLLPLTANNDYQGKTGSVDFNVKAVQVRNNDGSSAPQSWS